MKKNLKKFIKGYFAIAFLGIAFTLAASFFQSCNKEEYYQKTSTRSNTNDLKSYSKSLKSALENIKQDELLKKSNGKSDTKEAKARKLVNELRPSSLALLKTYGISERQLVDEFGDLNSDKIVLTALVVWEVEKMLDNGKTLSIFEDGDIDLAMLGAFGINSTYAQNTVGGCLADAIGVYAVVEFAQTGQLSQTAVIKLVKKVGAKYLGAFGAALAVWDFVNCMGWV
jgi:hypothetical protein